MMNTIGYGIGCGQGHQNNLFKIDGLKATGSKAS